MDELRLPPPGLQGDWRDTCVVCMKGTDTGMSFVGPAEWCMAALRVLGIEAEQARRIVYRFIAEEDLAEYEQKNDVIAANREEAVDAFFQQRLETGQVPIAELEMPIRLCQTCLDASGQAAKGMTVALLTQGAPLPTYRPRN